MFTARLAWGGCSVSTHLHSQSVMQEQGNSAPLCPALLPSEPQCMCSCAYVCMCYPFRVQSGWSRVVCVKGCDIKVFWSLPPLSSAMSPFICEAHFISLPPSLHLSLSLLHLIFLLCWTHLFHSLYTLQSLIVSKSPPTFSDNAWLSDIFFINTSKIADINWLRTKRRKKSGNWQNCNFSPSVGYL